MPKSVFHFLNVKEGDCSIIQHESGHVSVIDVCTARKDVNQEQINAILSLIEKAGISGNFQQKRYPVNPIEYLKKFKINSIFRFVLTHPDMDHMDGIKDLFEVFNPVNFYDIKNNLEKEFNEGSPYREEDWLFYKNLRDKNPQTNPKRLLLYSGDDAPYRTRDWSGNPPGDSFYILAPTKELVQIANENNDFNDCSYVILQITDAGRILISGDSHDKTWEHVLEEHKELVENIDLLIAPHHGRKSNRNYSFLDILKPKLTFFGNARAEHLAYSAWHYRELRFITNNQANSMIVDCRGEHLILYVTYQPFAQKLNPNTFYSEEFNAYYIGEIN